VTLLLGLRRRLTFEDHGVVFARNHHRLILLADFLDRSIFIVRLGLGLGLGLRFGGLHDRRDWRR